MTRERLFWTTRVTFVVVSVEAVSDVYDRDKYFVNAVLVMNMSELINSMKLKTMTRCDNGEVRYAGDFSLP